MAELEAVPAGFTETAAAGFRNPITAGTDRVFVYGTDPLTGKRVPNSIWNGANVGTDGKALAMTASGSGAEARSSAVILAGDGTPDVASGMISTTFVITSASNSVRLRLVAQPSGDDVEANGQTVILNESQLGQSEATTDARGPNGAESLSSRPFTLPVGQPIVARYFINVPVDGSTQSWVEVNGQTVSTLDQDKVPNASVYPLLELDGYGDVTTLGSVQVTQLKTYDVTNSASVTVGPGRPTASLPSPSDMAPSPS